SFRPSPRRNPGTSPAKFPRRRRELFWHSKSPTSRRSRLWNHRPGRLNQPTSGRSRRTQAKHGDTRNLALLENTVRRGGCQTAGNESQDDWLICAFSTFVFWSFRLGDQPLRIFWLASRQWPGGRLRSFQRKRDIR